MILFQPQIPQNTGNIARTCSVTGTDLALVKPLGFKIDDKTVKRAGLDYWGDVNVSTIDDLAEYLENRSAPFYFLSSHATKPYSDVESHIPQVTAGFFYF